MGDIQHFPLATHFAFPPSVLLGYSPRNSLPRKLRKIISTDVTNRNARKSTPHNFRCADPSLRVSSSTYGCFAYFLPSPMKFRGEKWPGKRQGAITARQRIAIEDHVSRFRTWYRNSGQCRHAAHIDFNKRARRMAEYTHACMRACVYVCVRFYAKCASGRAHVERTCRLWGDRAIFVVQNVLFFFPLSNTYVKHLAKDTWSICARQLLSH